MARLLEDLSKSILADEGMPVPQNRAVVSGAEAKQAASMLGKPVVLKALVPVGKRGKAGAIKFADTPEEADAMADELLNMTVSNYPVEKVLVEEKLDIVQELYLSITYDRMNQRAFLVCSSEGGIDIEEVHKSTPEKVLTTPIDTFIGLPGFMGRQIWSELGATGKQINALGGVTCKLYSIFDKYDAYLLEINPLVITAEGKVIAAASVMGIDDGAMFRQKQLVDKVQMGTERAWRPLTDLEKQGVAVNEADPYRGTARYTEMDGGEIGFMCGGGGGSLLLFDALVQAGGQPANYSEFGGNPSAEKVYGLAKVILSKPGVKGLFVAQNITNNTQVDLVAQGVIRAVKELNIDPNKFPIVIREAGVNEAEARALFKQAGIEYYGDEVTMTEAAQRMVDRMKEKYPGYGEEVK